MRISEKIAIGFIIISFCLLGVSLVSSNAQGVEEMELRQQFRDVLISQVGVHETSTNCGPEVREYLRSIDLGCGYAWCAALPHWGFRQIGIIQPFNGWAPTAFPRSRLIYQRGAIDFKRAPMMGDLFGIYYARKNRIAHVGIVDIWPPEGSTFISIEGNTNLAGSREGTHVLRKRRKKKQVYAVSDWFAGI